MKRRRLELTVTLARGFVRLPVATETQQTQEMGELGMPERAVGVALG